jgi:glycogen debranching enzyme
VLAAGLAEPARAQRVVRALLDPTSFNGWGVRTIASTEARYNPMSYHNGSLWPHDNSMVAAGLARYGYKAEALAILRGLFDASRMMDLNRLPELFCGFDRQPGQGPTLYPVACSPQAWSSGAVFHLLQSCLGMRFSPDKPQLQLDHPVLPDDVDRIAISDLVVHGGSVDLVLMRHGSSVSLYVPAKRGDVEVAIRM